MEINKILTKKIQILLITVFLIINILVLITFLSLKSISTSTYNPLVEYSEQLRPSNLGRMIDKWEKIDNYKVILTSKNSGPKELTRIGEKYKETYGGEGVYMESAIYYNLKEEKLYSQDPVYGVYYEDNFPTEYADFVDGIFIDHDLYDIKTKPEKTERIDGKLAHMYRVRRSDGYEDTLVWIWVINGLPLKVEDKFLAETVTFAYSDFNKISKEHVDLPEDIEIINY